MSPFTRFRLRQISRAIGIRFRSGTHVARDMDAICRHLFNIGFRPKTIVDVGVADGTLELYRHFPHSKLELVEPIEEFRSSIEGILKKYPGNVHFVAAGPKDQEVSFAIDPDVSAWHNAKLATGRRAATRVVQMRRLDTILKDVEGPVLLKIDVEGFELGVVDGAPELMRLVEVAILETRMIQTVEESAIFSEVCSHMVALGFEVYDIIDMVARPLDGALVLCDIVFVRRDGPFRSDRRYESEEQARRHARRLMPTIRRLLRL
jgi:FkbM family methyltransferase